MFHEALSAIQAGDRARARDLLTRLLKTDKENPDYWVWMSAVVETTKERTYCLKEVLRLDPQNPSAKRGLAMLGAMPPDESLALPAAFQKHSWQVKLPSDLKEEKVSGPPKWQLAAMGVALVVVVALLVYAFTAVSQNRRRQAASYGILPTTTQVLAVDTTKTAVTPVATSGSPTPLWMLLEATYTPTPLFVNTPHSSEAYRIALRAFSAGDWAKAETYFIQVATAEPGSVDVLYYLGESSRLAGNTKQAIEWYNQAIELNASFAPSYVGRARARLAANPKAVKDALNDLATATQLDPKLGEAYLAVAELRLQGKQPQDALDALTGAAEVMPDSPLVYLYRAEANLALGDADQALADAQKAKALDITLLPAYRMIGEVLLSQGDSAGALDALTTFVRYSPNDADAWVWISKAYLEAEKTDDALKALDRALRLNSNITDAHLVRGQILLEKNRAKDALNDFEYVLRVNKNSFEALMGSAQALLLLDYPGDAYNSVEKAKSLIETDAQQAEWFFWRARSLDKLTGFEDVALKDYQKLLDLPKSSVKAEWRQYAQERIAKSITATPTQKSKTVTATPTPKGKTAAATPTVTPTLTPTGKVSKSPTLTATRKP
jgi:tetratricopeptide (TPR) repeat protein